MPNTQAPNTKFPVDFIITVDNEANIVASLTQGFESIRAQIKHLDLDLSSKWFW